MIFCILWMELAADLAFASSSSLAERLLKWAPIALSLLALLVSGWNTWIVLRRGKKRVRIRSSIRMEAVGSSSSSPLYVCTVTNVGYIGLQVDRVELRSTAGAAMGVMLSLADGEEPRKLDQGEAQEWGAFVSDANKGSTPPGELPQVSVVAVAVDTAGEEHVQRCKDSLAIPAGS